MSDTAKYDVSIDEHRLDKEWVEQPERYHVVAREQADAQSKVDLAKSRVEFVKGKLYKEIAAQPQDFGLAKATEASVNAAIATHPEYVKAVEEAHEAKHRAHILTTVVTAFDQRKRALEKLVDLKLADYFSQPTAKSDNKEAVKEMEEDVRLRRRRRRREGATKK